MYSEWFFFFFFGYITSIFRLVCESEKFYDATSNFVDYIMKEKILQSAQLESNNLERKN